MGESQIFSGASFECKGAKPLFALRLKSQNIDARREEVVVECCERQWGQSCCFHMSPGMRTVKEDWEQSKREQGHFNIMATPNSFTLGHCLRDCVLHSSACQSAKAKGNAEKLP